MADTVKRVETYKMSYKFNASHNTSGNWDGTHMHTFRIVVVIDKTSNDFVDFYVYEKAIKNLVDRYSGKCFNDFDEFRDVRPTIENIGIYFYHALKELFGGTTMLSLSQVEFGDSPTQSFSISEKYRIRNMNRSFTKEEIEFYTDKSKAKLRKKEWQERLEKKISEFQTE